jgi:hypothetical protein
VKTIEGIAEDQSKGRLPVLGLAALGIVFGDIGTSPLYTFQTILHMSQTPGANSILGALSLGRAKTILAEVDAAVATWRDEGRALGMTAAELETFSDAFEHDERQAARDAGA